MLMQIQVMWCAVVPFFLCLFLHYVPDSTASTIGGSAPEREIQHLFAEIDRNASEVCVQVCMHVESSNEPGILIAMFGCASHTCARLAGSIASQGEIFA